MKVIKIYTDGGYRRKSKLGAYAYVILINGVIVKEYKLAVPQNEGIKVTNNTMEMNAVLKALNWLVSNGYKAEDYVVYVWTDSQYVQLGLTEWIHNWKKNGWKNASRKPIENKDLWNKLDNLFNNLGKVYKSINIQWVEGHSGDEWNDKVDALCNEAMDEYVINVDYERIKK